MGNFVTCGPSTALVISGGCCNGKHVQPIVGGYGWRWWLLSDVQWLSLSLVTLTPRCEQVETRDGVPITVTGVAQIKFMREEPALRRALEHFLGKSEEELQGILLGTLEGHLRAILGTLSVEDIYSDRDKFSSSVRETVKPDFGLMGVDVISFVLKDVWDSVDYLDSVGREQIAVVKRDADIGVAEAERDATIEESKCELTRKDVCFTLEAEIAKYKKEHDLKLFSFDAEVNKSTAEVNLAYELQSKKETQKLCAEKVSIEVEERRKQIELEEKEIQCADKRMFATVRCPAEAEAYRKQKLAEAERTRQTLIGRAEAERLRTIGLAEAHAADELGDAEAEGLKLTGEAYAKYGEVARLKLTTEALPTLAKEAAAPLKNIGEIVLLNTSTSGDTDGGQMLSNFGKDLVNFIGVTKPAIKAITKIDLAKSISNVLGASA